MKSKFYDIEQNTDEWFDLRSGKLTGSAVGKVMANYGKAFGKPAHELALQLALEQIKGTPMLSNYSNYHMERGHEQEPIARMEYEKNYFVDVLNGGFYCNELTGVSPDGRVGEDGLIEIKSVIYPVHFDNVRRGNYDPKYKWQYFFNLKETGAKWIDTISFCAEFPENKRLYVFRIWAKDAEEEFTMINSRTMVFFKLVDEKKKFIEVM